MAHYQSQPLRDYPMKQLVLVLLAGFAFAKDKKPPIEVEVVASHAMHQSYDALTDHPTTSFNLDVIIEKHHVTLECAAPDYAPCPSLSAGKYDGRFKRDRELVEIDYVPPLVGGLKHNVYKVGGTW
jgi:hypothetical protein